MTVETVRVLLEAVRVIIEAVRKIIETVRLFVDTEASLEIVCRGRESACEAVREALQRP